MADDLKFMETPWDDACSYRRAILWEAKLAMTLLWLIGLHRSMIVVDIGLNLTKGGSYSILEAMDIDRRYKERKRIEGEFSEKIHSQKIVQLMMKNLGRDSDGFGNLM